MAMSRPWLTLLEAVAVGLLAAIWAGGIALAVGWWVGQ